MFKHTFYGLCLVAGLTLSANAVSAQDRDVIAGIPVNYDESKVGDYKQGLPDLLTMNNGKKVTTAKQWMSKRRPEILKILQENQYGKWMAKKPKLRYSVEQDLGLEGSAVRKQVTVYFTPDDNGPRVDVLVYLPKDANGPTPLLLNLSFSPNNMTVNDPGVKVGRRWDARTKEMVPASMNGAMGGFRFGMDNTIKEYLKEGFGFATLCYTDITPDFQDDAKLGVRGLYKDPGADGWGSISCWAWGVSNVMDYFEKDPDIDATRIALTGCSRLGKTTIWTGAMEQRIKVVMPSCSGEGGAAISRRVYGETVAHLTEPSRFPYQFAANYGKWANNMTNMPMDAHMVVALIAPRPLLLQTGSTDTWSDPTGEWLSAIEASPVYALFGKDNVSGMEMPGPDQPIYHTLGYVMHDGGHGTVPADWKYYLEFMKMYL